MRRRGGRRNRRSGQAGSAAAMRSRAPSEERGWRTTMEEREVALSALAEEVRARMQTARSEYVDREGAFSAARAVVEASRDG